jgi:signal peptidase II
MFRYFWIAVVIMVLDQLSKWAAMSYLFGKTEVQVMPFLNLVLVFNSGAAFGFLSSASGWQNLFFVGVALVACVVILMMVRRLGVDDKQVMVGLMLILGGAIGNMIDRVRLSYVIDFIDVFYGSWHWPAFNVADSAITIGAVLLVLDALGLGRRKRHGEDAP